MKNSTGTILSLIFGLFFIGLGIYLGTREAAASGQGTGNIILTAAVVLAVGILYAIIRYRNMKK